MIKVLLITMWIVLGCGTVTLLVAAAEKTNHRQCAGIHVRISGVSNNFFIDKTDVENIIAANTGNTYKGKAISNFDLRSMEKILKKEVWIKNAELYFDNNNLLQAEIEEREPVVRIFTSSGTSYYVDSSLMMLPLSEKFSASLPVFTNFPSDARVLSKRDSLLLKDVEVIGEEIMNDPFLMAMIDQVDITPQRTFEMLPKLGNQLIVFGDASQNEQKFSKLKMFYRNIITKAGWGKYSQINLQYDNQVVAKIRGKEDVSADSLRTVMLMKMIAEVTEKMASDSVKMFLPDSEKNTDSTIVMESLQRDEAIETDNETPAFLPLKPVMNKATVAIPAPLKPITKPAVSKPVAPSVKKTVTKMVKKEPVKKTNTNKPLPKAIMPKRTN